MKKFVGLSVALLSLILGTVSRAESPSPTPEYPLKTCVVSDEKLGEMGAPFKYDYKGRTVMLCCKSCVKKFNKDPEKYLKKLDQAQAKPAK